ncbi:MAG: methyl-accepting chemotaxis protein [Spirochaetes bacterium]|nr:methyl-accepting chemotaxis protein [Spirochaetota bacterium]
MNAKKNRFFLMIQIIIFSLVIAILPALLLGIIIQSGSSATIQKLLQEQTSVETLILDYKAKLQPVIILILLGTAVIAGMIGVILSLFINNSLKNIETTIQLAGSGDLITKTSSLKFLGGLKELKRLLYTEFIATIKEKLDQLRSLIIIREDINDKFSVQVQQTMIATNMMGENVTAIRRDINELDIKIAESSAAIEEILANINNLKRSIDDQSSAITETSTAIEQIISNIQSVARVVQEKQTAIQELMKITDLGGQKVYETNNIIQEINKGIDDMQDMISVVDNVADKTNMLALNAAIEAAHAGEAGQGFAVVASEIQELATSAADSAKNISASLNQIIENIKIAASISEETGDAFSQINSGVGEFVGAFEEISQSTSELSTGSNEILKAVDRLQQVSYEIQDGSQEMQKGAEDINQVIISIKDFSNTTVEKIDEVGKSAWNVNDFQGEMTSLIVGNNENAEHFYQLIDKFTFEENQDKEEGSKKGRALEISSFALMIQAWLGNVRVFLDRPEIGDPDQINDAGTHQWIADIGQKLHGNIKSFQKFLTEFRVIEELIHKTINLKQTGKTSEIDPTYFQMIPHMNNAKSALWELKDHILKQ